MVNKANMRLWANALKTGDYTQGREFLKQIEGAVVKYCCLGVACEVAIANGVKLDVGLSQQVFNFGERTGVLPDAVIQWLGLPAQAHDPIVVRTTRATAANDIVRLSFEQIANGLIETYELEQTDEPAK